MANKNVYKSVKRKLKNHTEEVVLDTIKQLLADEEFKDACTCEKCILDIATYTLNRLPAKYVASSKGDVFTKIEDFEQQFNVDLISTVTKAIEIVNRNPHGHH